MIARQPLRFLAALLFCSVIYLGFASAQPDNPKKSNRPALQPPAVLELNDVPRNADDLAGIEKHVQQVVAQVTPAVVGIVVGPGQGSGVIISEDGYVLTAGHVSGKPNQNCWVILPSGEKLKAKTLGQDKDIDSGLIQITDEKAKGRKFPYLDMGKSGELKKGQWVIAIGHPGGFRKNRTPVVRVGRILFIDGTAIQTDCTLVGGDSGGPLFDMKGNVIGIHSRIGGEEIYENLHVPIDTYKRNWTKLAEGKSWGEGIGKQVKVRSAGGKEVFNKKDALTNNDPAMPAPSGKSGQSHYKKYTFHMKAGHTYTLDLFSRDKSDKFDPFLKLESPEGKALAEDDDSAGNPNARIVYKALREGDYRLTATSFESDQTGPYTLKIFEADFKDAVVSGSVDVWKVMRVPPPQITRLVDDFAKVEIPLHLNALLIDDKGNPLPNKEITVQWDKGKQTFKSNADGIVRWALAKDKSRKLNLQIPNGIRAMVAMTDKDGKTIPLFTKGEDPSIEKIKSAGGPIVKTFQGTLTKKDPFDFERDQCHRHIHEFPMQAGKTYTLDLLSEDFDAFLRLENDDNSKLAEDDDSAGNNNARILFTPESTGTYRLVVTTCDPGQYGAYRLVIQETDAKPAPSKNESKK